MNSLPPSTLIPLLALLLLPGSLEAKPPKNQKTTATYGCARFDVNENGVLEADEKEALIRAFQSGDTALKPLDVNNDGKLDEAELAAIKLPTPQKGGKKKKQ
jgi:hypothetical protein